MAPDPAASFRRQARQWLDALGNSSATGRRTFFIRGRRVAVFGRSHLRQGHAVDSILLVRGDFSCGAGCIFPHPVYVAGNAEIGKGSRIHALAADGALVLGPAVEVDSWAECGRDLEIRPGCRIGDCAISRTRVRLTPGSEVSRVFAPEIVSQGAGGEQPLPYIERAGVVELPIPGNARRLPSQAIPGLKPQRLHAVSADTWFYDGDLYLSEPAVLSAHLVTRGYFACQAGTLLEGDVRAGTALYMGGRSLARGHLLARGDLVIEAESTFQGDVHGQRHVRVCSGVRGFRAGGPVEVTAAGRLVLEDSVVVRGSIQATERILTATPERLSGAEPLLASGW